MKIFSVLVLLLSLMVGNAQDMGARLDSLTAVYEANNFHGVILIAKGDQVLYTKAYGYANWEKKIPHKTSTLFKTESVGKMFTATAIMQLVEKGRLRLDQTIKDILPELNVKNADKITVHQLLNHTSGLQSPWDHSKWNFKRNYTKEELVKIVEEVPLAFETPGKTMFYSNSGYFILGWIIQKISGLPYDEYYRKNIFDASGMQSIGHLNDTIMPVQKGAQPYRIVSTKRFIRMDETVGPKASAAGGWVTTANDLYKFILALKSNKLISQQSWDIMRTANGTAPKDSQYRYYAYGLETYNNQPFPGARLVGHNGGGAGFSVDAMMDEATGYIVVSCTNLYQDSRPIAINFLKATMGMPLQPVATPSWVQLMDIIDEKGMDGFLANEKEYFGKVGMKPTPWHFAMLNDAMGAVGENKMRLQWMELARKYYPANGFVLMVSGDTFLAAGQTDDARKMYLAAKELGEKNNDSRVREAAEGKLKEVNSK